MTLRNVQRHSPIAKSLYKCDFSHELAAVGKISTDTERRAVPLWQPSLSRQQAPAARHREASGSETRVLSDTFRSSATRKHSSDNSALPSPHRRRYIAPVADLRAPGANSRPFIMAALRS